MGDMNNLFKFRTDAIVMLTMSNWFKELRSNRYHYATRLANTYPVIFVQPDLVTDTYHFEATEHGNIIVLHVYEIYGITQSRLLRTALSEKKIVTPLLWVYNSRFIDFIKKTDSSFILHHATEDYLSCDVPMQFTKGSFAYTSLLQSMIYADLVMCVSEGVKESIEQTLPISNKLFVNTNGCDFEFYAQPYLDSFDAMLQQRSDKKIAFYQGNIFHKLDFQLLIELAENMPEWEFHFCGPVVINDNQWLKLLQFNNVKHLGVFTPEQLRDYSYRATVGIIPFSQHDYLKKRSFPLKAFEYLACGLPVVTSPIDALTPYQDLFIFANNAEEFQNALIKAATHRYDRQELLKRLNEAKKLSYNHLFSLLLDKINQHDILHRKSLKEKREFFASFLKNNVQKKITFKEFFNVRNQLQYGSPLLNCYAIILENVPILRPLMIFAKNKILAKRRRKNRA